VHRAVVVALACLACGRASTRVAPDPAPLAPAASTAPSSTGTAIATNDAGPIGCAFDARWAKTNEIDVDAWRAAHGVTKAFLSKGCWDAGDRVGVPPAPGLLCLAVFPSPYKSIASDVRARVLRLDGDRLVMVWEETVATYANWLELTPTFSSNGATLTLHDSAPHRCEGAIRESFDKDAANVGIDGLSALLVQACKQRGVYAWTGKHYARAEDPTKLAAGDLAGDPCPPDAKESDAVDDLGFP